MLIAHYFRIIVSIFKEMFSLVLFRMISNVFWRAVSIRLGHFISIRFIWMIVAVILWTITDILRWAEINGLDMISLSLSLYFVCVSVQRIVFNLIGLLSMKFHVFAGDLSIEKLYLNSMLFLQPVYFLLMFRILFFEHKLQIIDLMLQSINLTMQLMFLETWIDKHLLQFLILRENGGLFIYMPLDLFIPFTIQRLHLLQRLTMIDLISKLISKAYGILDLLLFLLLQMVSEHPIEHAVLGDLVFLLRQYFRELWLRNDFILMIILEVSHGIAKAFHFINYYRRSLKINNNYLFKNVYIQNQLKFNPLKGVVVLLAFVMFFIEKNYQQLIQACFIWIKFSIEMHKLLGFVGIMGLSGLAYLKYYEYSKINKDIETLMTTKEIASHLYQTNQQSAFSIDSIMDSFQRGYNQMSIQKYRETLAGMCQGKVLQTCAGSNRNLRFYKPGVKLTLIDMCPNMISIGSSKTSPFISYDYTLGDVMQMPFSDDTFDSVIDVFGLQYVLNPHKALQEIRRVCKKEGRIILMNEGLSDIVQFHYYQNMKWGYNLIKGGFFSNRNWQKLIKQFDFEVQHVERKKNGKIYIFVLNNIKKTKEVAKEVL